MTDTRATAQAWGLSGLKLIAAMNIVPVAAVVVRLPGFDGGIPQWLAGPLAGYGSGAGLATLAMGAAFGSLRYLDRAEALTGYRTDCPPAQGQDLRMSDMLMYVATGLAAAAIVTFMLSTLLLAATGRA